MPATRSSTLSLTPQKGLASRQKEKQARLEESLAITPERGRKKPETPGLTELSGGFVGFVPQNQGISIVVYVAIPLNRPF